MSEKTPSFFEKYQFVLALMAGVFIFFMAYPIDYLLETMIPKAGLLSVLLLAAVFSVGAGFVLWFFMGLIFAWIVPEIIDSILSKIKH